MNVRGVSWWVPAAAAGLLAACALGPVAGPNRTILQDAATLVQECRYDEAEALIRAHLGTIPERYRAELMLAQGQIDEARGQLGPAIGHYAAAAAGRAAPESAGRLLGRAQVHNRQFEDGYRTLSALRGEIPLMAAGFDWIDMAALAVAAAETGRMADAADALREAFRLSAQPYDPVIAELGAHLAAARASPGSAAPGGFWQPAYGTEGAGLALDKRPVAVERKLPDVPANPKAERAGGHIVLFLDITATGAVAEAKVMQSDPPGRLEVTSVAAVREWRFEPAREQCQAVAASGIQRFEFGPGL